MSGLASRIEKLEATHIMTGESVLELIAGAERIGEIVRKLEFWAEDSDDVPLELQLERVKAESSSTTMWCLDRTVHDYRIREIEIAIRERDGLGADKVRTLRNNNLRALRGFAETGAPLFHGGAKTAVLVPPRTALIIRPCSAEVQGQDGAEGTYHDSAADAMGDQAENSRSPEQLLATTNQFRGILATQG